MPIVSDLLSVVPSFSADVKDPPRVGSKVPNSVQVFPTERISRPLLLYFPRHCGCPFPERDIHNLVSLLLSGQQNSTKDVSIVFLPHASVPSEGEAWFRAVLDSAIKAFEREQGQPISPEDRALLDKTFSITSDPSRTIAKSYGLGSLPSFSSLFGSGTFKELGKVNKLGIYNRITASGSDRWASHGACSIDATGQVRWYWKGGRAAEECNWREGLSTLDVPVRAVL